MEVLSDMFADERQEFLKLRYGDLIAKSQTILAESRERAFKNQSLETPERERPQEGERERESKRRNNELQRQIERRREKEQQREKKRREKLERLQKKMERKKTMERKRAIEQQRKAARKAIEDVKQTVFLDNLTPAMEMHALLGGKFEQYEGVEEYFRGVGFGHVN